jgi:hypothetical protein
LLIKYKEQHLKHFYKCKEKLKYYLHAQMCVQHRVKERGALWSNYDIESFIANSERISQLSLRIGVKRIAFEKVNSCYRFVKKYSSSVISLGVFLPN